MSDFPRMLYRPGTAARVWGLNVDTLIVRDEDEQKVAIGDGWTLRPDDEPGKPTAPHPQLDHDNNGADGGSIAALGDLGPLRAEYKRVVGKKAFSGWDEAELRRRIAEHGKEG